MRVPVGGAVMPARTVAPVVVASLALVATLEVYSAQADEGNRQAAHRYRADAVLLEASGFPIGSWKGVAHQSVNARITWTGRDGLAHIQQSVVPPNEPAGKHVTVWLDSSGALTTAPIGRVEALLVAGVTGVSCVLAGLLGLSGARAARRVWLARRAASRIDYEWELAAPSWTERRT
ncbi:MAG TPA: hypothetical protein VNW94_07685 [Streptosporangiaceae bacterium]|jgi:hypothetical protein|nr:hypothetical protein [Streptosporangiaceae bacterium]